MSKESGDSRAGGDRSPGPDLAIWDPVCRGGVTVQEAPGLTLLGGWPWLPTSQASCYKPLSTPPLRLLDKWAK